MPRSRAAVQVQRGVSSLWPVLPFEGPDPRDVTLPDGVAEQMLEMLKGCRDTLRALRLVSRATRAAVDARVRCVRIGQIPEIDPDYHDPNPPPPEVLEKCARFPGLERVEVGMRHDTADAVLAGLIRGLPRMRHLKEVYFFLWEVGADTPERSSLVARLARALPWRLEKLELILPEHCVEFEALVEATAALPNLRLLMALCPIEPVHADTRQLLLPALRRTMQPVGACSNLRVLSLECLDPDTYDALAAATQLTALRELGLSQCQDAVDADPDTEDGGLHLLAAAPWMRQLTKLWLAADSDFTEHHPTDALFTGLRLPRLEELEILSFNHTAASPTTGAPAGLATASLPALTSLHLGPRSSKPANLKAIAAAPWYAGLSKLNAHMWHDEDNERVMLGVPFTALTELIVSCDVASRDLVNAVTAAPMLRSLRSLTLRDHACTDELRAQRARVDDWAAFARAPFAALRELDLSGAQLSDESQAAVREAAWITRLTKLTLIRDD